MRHISLFIIAFLSLYAQNEVPAPLKNQRELPYDFYTGIWDRIEKQVATIPAGDEKAAQKKEFYIRSNYQLSYLFKSGQIIYGDPMNDYINQVAEKVIGDDVHLKEELRFYINRSSEVNAFSTNQGAIFINVGLIAQIENEAQLALILAHEIEHYVQNHTLDGFIHDDEVESGQNGKVNTDYSAIFTRSKEMELEADKFGIKRFLKAGYMPQALLNSFDVLLYSYLAFDEVPFDSTYFDNGDFKLLEYKVKEEIKYISAREDVDDSEHTHPNIKKRIKNAYKNLEKEGVTAMNDGQIYQVTSEEEFKAIQKRSRFELLRILFESHYYDRALYTCFLLEKKYGNSQFLEWHKAQMMYFIATYSIDGSISKAVSSYSKIEGEQQALNYALRKMKKKDICAIAMNQMYAYFMKYPGETEKYIYFEDLLYKIKKNNVVDLDNLVWQLEAPKQKIDEPIDEEPTELDSLDPDAEEVSNLEQQEVNISRNSKYSRIRKKKEESAVTVKGSHVKVNKNNLKDYLWQHAFTGFDATLFDSLYDPIVKYLDNKDKEDVDEKESGADRKRRERYGISEHLNNIAVLDPQVMVLNVNLNHPKAFDKVKKKDDLGESFLKYAQDLDLNTELLKLKHLGMMDTTELKEYSDLFRWTVENIKDDNNHIPYLNDLAHKLRTEKKLDYLCFSIIGSVEVSGKNYTFIYFITLDLYNGSIEYATERMMKGKMKPLKLEAHIYDILSIIK